MAEPVDTESIFETEGCLLAEGEGVLHLREPFHGVPGDLMSDPPFHVILFGQHRTSGSHLLEAMFDLRWFAHSKDGERAFCTDLLLCMELMLCEPVEGGLYLLRYNTHPLKPGLADSKAPPE